MVTDTENQIPQSGNPSAGLGREMVVLYRKLGTFVSQNRSFSYTGRVKGFSAYPDSQKFISVITKNIFILKLANFHSSNEKEMSNTSQYC